MWKAVFRNSSGGDLDQVEAETEEGLREALCDKFNPFIGWVLAAGDTLTITEDSDVGA